MEYANENIVRLSFRESWDIILRDLDSYDAVYSSKLIEATQKSLCVLSSTCICNSLTGAN